MQKIRSYINNTNKNRNDPVGFLSQVLVNIDKVLRRFEDMKRSLTIQRDMWGYSSFIITDESQLTSAIDVINHSYNLKKERGRLYMH